MKKVTLLLVAFITTITLYLIFSLLLSDGGMFFRKELTIGYSLHKDFFANNYNLVHKKDGLIVIKGIKNWIITPDYLYGNYETKGQPFQKNNKQEFFLLKRESTDVEIFSTMIEINTRLRQIGLVPYDLSDEESFVHLKYHKRKYATKQE